MADGVVEVTPSTDPTLKKIDNEFLTVGANSVYRQRVAVPDGADVAQGSTADASSANTLIGLLKAIKAAIQGTLTVGGTVTANAGTNLNTSNLALDATLTGGTQKAIARGGAKGTTAAADLTSNPVDANTQALHVDGSKVTQPVSGTFWQATQPVSGTVTVQQSTAANLKVDLSGTAANGTAIKVDGSAVTQPVSLAANQSVNVAQVNAGTAVASVTGVQDVMPRKRTGSTGLSPNYSASHITTNTTTTPTAATAYVSAVVVSASGAGSAWTVKIQNKEATPKILVPSLTVSATVSATNPLVLQFAEPILMTSGIDIVTAGTTAGTLDVFITYWQ